MFDFEKRLAELSKQTVLCVGDLMLDDFVYGEVSRISPEAPAPVIAVSREDMVIGGAGNVARNVASLGGRCIFVGVVGADPAGKALAAAFAEWKNIRPHLVVDVSRPTTRKLRFVSEHHSTHLLRADWEQATPVAGKIEVAVVEHTGAAVAQAGAVVLSDYAKGVLTQPVIRTVIERARKLKKPVVVDPKGIDFGIYRGATVIKPNRKELSEATRMPAGTDAEIAKAAGVLAEMCGSEAVLVSLSEAGATLVVRGKPPIHVPAYPVKVVDTSGAGDTVVAALALFLAQGAGYEEAMRAANAAAAI